MENVFQAVKTRYAGNYVQLAKKLFGWNFDQAKITGDEYLICSPLRSDKNPSFSVNNEKGMWKDWGTNGGGLLLSLFIDGFPSKQDAIRSLCDVVGVPFEERGANAQGVLMPPQVIPEPQESQEPLHLKDAQGCSMDDFCRLKNLDRENLEKKWGVKEIERYGKPALRLPYFNEAKKEIGVRYRVANTGKSKFIWEKGSTAKSLLYGENVLLRADKNTNCLFIVEGESDTITMRSCYGAPCIGIPGKGLAKNHPRLASVLAQLENLERIIVIQEPDAQDFSQSIATLLSKEYFEIVSVDFHAATGFKDVSAAWASGQVDTREKLQEKMANENHVVVMKKKGFADSRLIDLNAERFIASEFLWEPFLARGQIALFFAKEGIGKSTISYKFAAMAAGKCPTPSGEYVKKENQGKTMLVTYEESRTTIKMRAAAHGMQDDLLPFNLENGAKPADILDELKRHAKRKKIRMLIIDPWMSFVSAMKDSNSNTEARTILNPIKTLAEELGIVVVIVNHVSKGSDKRDVNERSLGTSALSQMSRCNLMAERMEDHRLYLGVSKCSKAQPAQRDRVYLCEVSTHIEQLDGGKSEQIGYLKDWAIDPTKTFNNVFIDRQSDKPKGDQCKEFLTDWLYQKKGYRALSTDLQLAAKMNGYGEGLTCRALNDKSVFTRIYENRRPYIELTASHQQGMGIPAHPRMLDWDIGQTPLDSVT